MDRPMNTAPPPARDMGALLDRLLDEAEQSPAPSGPIPSGGEPPASPPSPSPLPTAGDAPPVGEMPNPMASLLGGLAANPALLSALPALLENLGPLLSGLRSGGAVAGGTAPRAVGGHRTLDRHTALLCAVKPYLGAERQAAAETVIRLCRVWDALERSGVSLPGLLAGLGGNASSPPAVLPASESEVP